MKTSIKFLSVLFITAILVTSCSDDKDDNLEPVAHSVVITANPTTVITGDATVELSTEITDLDATTPAPTYTYKWYKSATETEDGDVIEGATESMYTTPDATTLTVGSHYYYVEVEDGTSNAFNPVKSNVITVVVN